MTQEEYDTTPDTHLLKVLPEYFRDVLDNTKQFEIRKNDRDFKEGDILKLREYDPVKNEYSGWWVAATFERVYPLDGIGISGFVAMSIKTFESND